MSHTSFLVTGMARSGTTLVEKLLSNHDDLSVLAQPFPLLYVEAKHRFMASRSIDAGGYPLSHYFLEDRFTSTEFTEYLEKTRFTATDIAESLASMQDYSGALTDFGDIDELLRDVQPNELAVQLRLLHSRLADPGVRHHGSKEIYIEEFVPYLVDRGFQVFVVVRDPRDVIASLGYGDGRQYGGAVRPVLFHLRNWRRSLIFALAQETSAVQIVRYEDVVRDPVSSLRGITDALDVPPYALDAFAQGIRDQQGERWLGNSSHADMASISAESVSSYENMLPDTAVRYIETVCGPEMELLGYQSTDDSPSDLESLLTDFTEPVVVEREEFPAQYSSSPDNIEAELERIRLLHSAAEPDADTLRRYFGFERTYRRLRDAVYIH